MRISAHDDSSGQSRSPTLRPKQQCWSHVCPVKISFQLHREPVCHKGTQMVGLPTSTLPSLSECCWGNTSASVSPITLSHRPWTYEFLILFDWFAAKDGPKFSTCILFAQNEQNGADLFVAWATRCWFESASVVPPHRRGPRQLKSRRGGEGGLKSPRPLAPHPTPLVHTLRSEREKGRKKELLNLKDGRWREWSETKNNYSAS